MHIVDAIDGRSGAPQTWPADRTRVVLMSAREDDGCDCSFSVDQADAEILVAIRSGVSRVGKLSVASGLSPQDLHRRLRQLESLGLVRHCNRHWALGPTASA
jgi:hypothetical protein